MQEVARELQGIRQAQEEAIEVQKQSFQVELEKLEKIWDKKSKLLREEIKLLKNSKQYPAPKVLPGQSAAQNPASLAKSVTTSSNSNLDKIAEGETEERSSKEKTQVTKASIPNQPKQTQSLTGLLQQSKH